MKLHATPHNINATGFYFDTLSEYQGKYDANLPVEEYEIQMIDGDAFETALFSALKVDAATLEQYLDIVWDFDRKHDTAKAGLIYLLGNGYSLDSARENSEVVCVSTQEMKDYVYDLVDDVVFTCTTPDILKQYFDYETFARDMLIDGYSEFEFDGSTYVMNDNVI